MGIKTSSSVLLPVWNSSLEGRFKEAEKSTESAQTSDAVAAPESSAKESKKKRKSDAAEVPVKKTKVKETAGEVVKEPTVAGAEKSKSSETLSKADKIAKKAGKKSSSVGTGGAGKKAKTAIVGTA